METTTDTPVQKRMTSTQIIRMVLGMTNNYMAVHEITAFARTGGYYVSDNAAATRLSIDLKGEVESRYREGARYKEWRLIKKEAA